MTYIGLYNLANKNQCSNPSSALIRAGLGIATVYERRHGQNFFGRYLPVAINYAPEAAG